MKPTLAVVAVIALLATVFWLWTPDLKRAPLEKKYLRSKADMTNVIGTQLHVRDDGPKTAPAIIFLHGFGASLHTWEPWARALAADWRVIRYDQPGSGLSPPDATGIYTDARALQLLEALMDQLGVPRATLVGNSMGGRIAWSFAARQPQRVNQLVLISPDGFESQGFAYDKPAQVPAVLGLMRQVLPRPVLRMNLAPAYADPKALTDELVDRYFDLLRAPGAREAMLQRMRQHVLQNPVPWLQKITAPTLLLWGEDDKLIPIANADDYTRALPDSRLVRLTGLGHLPHEEDPARSLVPLRAFLDQKQAAGLPVPAK